MEMDLIRLGKEGESLPVEIQNALKKAQTVKVRVGIIGTKPLLMNPTTEQVIADLQGGAGKRSSADKKQMTNLQICQEKIIRYASDQGLVVHGCGTKEIFSEKVNLDNLPIGIPLEYLTACLRTAGSKVQLSGKTNISKADGSTQLFSLMDFHDDFFAFKDQDAAKSWMPDVRKGNLHNAGKKTAVPIERPLIKSGWAFDVNVTITTKDFSMDKIQELFTKAGKVSGLCDFRPSCGGPFGQFAVESWVILEIDGKDVAGKKLAATNGKMQPVEA